MVYSKNSQAYTRVKEFLNQMIASTERLEWVVEDASKTQYLIQEAITTSGWPGRADQPEFKAIAELRAKYIIRVNGKESKIIAEPRAKTALPSFKTMQLDGLSDPLEIIGAALEHNGQKMFFPDGEATEELYNWCSGNGYWIVESDIGITLTKQDPGDLAWKPV